MKPERPAPAQAPAGTSPAPGTGALGVALGGMLALAAAMGIGRFVYTPILPPMVDTLGFSQSAAGFIAAANFAGYLAGALLAASALIAGSRRRWLLGALALSAASTAAMALATSLVAFAAWRLAGGVASAFVLVFASALVLEHLVSAGRGGLSALHFAGVGVGIAMSAALVSALLAAGSDWRMLWLASGALAALALGAVAKLVPERAPPAAPAGAAAPAPARRRSLRALIWAYGLFGFGYVITATFLVAMVREAALAALEPAIWLLVGVAAIPSVALWTWAAARLGLARAFALACVVEALGIGASVLWPGNTGAVVAALALGGTFMGITALGLVGARRLAHGDARRTLAAMTAAFGLGQMLGPAFAGVLRDASGSFALPSLGAVGSLLLAAALVHGGCRALT